MKRKLLLPILSVCMVVALVSVGFAAWLITGNDTSDTAEGQFVTYGVTNEYYTVKIDDETKADKIVFGKKDGSYTYDWLKQEDVAEEKLTKTFKVTITFDDTAITEADAKKALDKWTISITFAGDSEGKYDACKADNYITFAGYAFHRDATPPADASYAEGSTISYSNMSFDSGVYTGYVTLKFGWGTKFNSTNPYEFYNGEENTTDNRSAATNCLKALNELNEKKFTLSLSATAV